MDFIYYQIQSNRSMYEKSDGGIENYQNFDFAPSFLLFSGVLLAPCKMKHLTCLAEYNCEFFNH